MAPSLAVLHDRAAGTLLAAAAGDALGAPFEGGSPPAGPIEMTGGGSAGWTPGEWTDDTSMTMCIAEVAATGVDLRAQEALAAIGKRFLDWYRRGAPGIGTTTRSVLAEALGPADLSRAAVAYHLRTRGHVSNGALMRTAPVALANLGDDRALVEAAMRVASLTHADPRAGESCAIWCISIDRAIRMDRLDGAWDALAHLPPDAQAHWEAILENATRLDPARIPHNERTENCLQAALAAIHLVGQDDLETGLQAAVHVNGDTDTVGAVAGALLGARWGASQVPGRWCAHLHDRWGRTAADLVALADKIASHHRRSV